MMINPTKKTLPLFSTLTQVSDANQGKAFSLTNPFFSWHANYYNVNRKKILVLVNDLTMVPVVIADVNAKNKKELAVDIIAGIRVAFKQAGVGDKNIQEYLTLAGEIEVNRGFNRPVTGVTTMFVREAAFFPLDLSQRIQPRLMGWLADTPIQRLAESFPLLALEKAIKNNLQILPIDEKQFASLKKKTDIEVAVTWKQFSEWKKYPKEGWFEGYETIVEGLEKNNELVLKAFQSYLSKDLGLSDKVVRRHIDNTTFFLDTYLTYYGIRTPVTDFFDVEDCLADFFPRKALWSSIAEVKRMGASLKKFYTFLEVAQVITRIELKEVKEHITMGVEVGVSNLKYLDDLSEFW